MKKKNLFLLSIVCLLSLCIFTGLLVYAFDLQAKKDLQDKTAEQEKTDLESPVPTNPLGDDTISDSEEANSDHVDTEDPVDKVTPTLPPLEEKDEESDSSESVQTEPIVLGFAGDVNLDESSYPAAKYDAENKNILGCLSEDLLKEMKSADIMMLNNEFPYSTRGTKTPDKSYTFRADPGRVDILKEMGVDIVSLANNHALDYGPDALIDTFDTLDGAGIDYIGAGMDLDRAKAPVYYTVGDKTIAYVAASRVVFAMDWYASENGLGMIGTYDPALILESIKEAKQNSDFVVIFVHWGVERENYPVDYQRTLAKQYIDAGADAVIGCHPHVMQGLEFYKGKPIAYSLGNFWFNNSSRESGMLKLYLNPDGSVRTQILPAMQESTYTYLLKEKNDLTSYIDFMEGISFDVNIDEDGYITPAD
jgi:poly-gamma-glutamate synthesis protein (capsule biosynthesis protein)